MNNAPFKLHLNDHDVTTGSIPVSWCLNRETLDELLPYQPRVILVTSPVDAYHSSKEKRHVADLKDGMAYVSFTKPGKNKISAFIIKNDSLRSLLGTVFGQRWGGEYTLQVLDQNGEEYSETIVGYEAEGQIVSGSGCAHCVAEQVIVDVPQECFAKEPSDWERAWVSWLFRYDRSVDECEFRRGRLFAYTLQVPIFIVNMIIRCVLFLLCLSLGARGTSMKYLLHPLCYSLGDALDPIVSGSIFVRPQPKWSKNKEDDFTLWESLKYVVQRGWSLPFTPLFVFVVYLITWLHAWKSVGIVFALLLGAIFLIACYGFAQAFLPEFLKNWFEKLMTSGQEEDVYSLVCTEDDERQPKPRKQSVKLRYQALKSKICKPYAR